MKQCSSGHAWDNGEKCDRCGGVDITAHASVEDQPNMNDESNTVEETNSPAPAEESVSETAPEEVAPAEDVEESEEDVEESVESEESESSDEADSAPAPALA